MSLYNTVGTVQKIDSAPAVSRTGSRWERCLRRPKSLQNQTLRRSHKGRPLRKHSWQYYFYIEIDGTINNDTGADMMEELGQVCDQLKVAGTFAPHTEI